MTSYKLRKHKLEDEGPQHQMLPKPGEDHKIDMVLVGAALKTSPMTFKRGAEREPSYTLDGNVNWCSLYGEQCGGSSKN